MSPKLTTHRRVLFASIIFIALGITLSNVFHDVSSSIGIVFIAVGGLFFIIGIKEKKKCCNE
jgi:hypothetical protein